MKKVMCAKCGGSTKTKMAKGGAMKTTVGKATPKGQIYGIPQTGPTGPNYQGVDTMKRGGMVKKQNGGPIIKSKKVRDVSLNTFGDSYAKTTKTKRDGSTVTKSVDTTRGYVPTASKTKTVTNKAGDATTSTKSIGYNKAVRKQLSTGKKAGRNPEDEVIVDGRQKGGAVKKYAKGGSSFGMLSVKAGVDKNPKATAADRIAGAKMKRGGSIKKK